MERLSSTEYQNCLTNKYIEAPLTIGGSFTYTTSNSWASNETGDKTNWSNAISINIPTSLQLVGQTVELEDEFASSGFFVHIFPHRIYDVKGFLTLQTPEQSYLMFFGFEENNFDESFLEDFL